MLGGEHSLNISALTVWDSQCLEDSERKDDSMNESVTKMFIEQPHTDPWLSQGAWLSASCFMPFC